MMRDIHDHEKHELRFLCGTELRNECHGLYREQATAAQVDTLKDRAVDIYAEFARTDAIACGGSPEDVRNHHELTCHRTKAQLMKERKQQSCGFGLLAFASFLSALLTIFRCIRDWRNGG